MSRFRTRKYESRASTDLFEGEVPNSTFSVDLQETFKLDDITDVQYQEVRLYIEGVPIPFEYISISNPYMQKPVATIAIPPSAGLSEIARNYFPKVHIFFRDRAHERYVKVTGREHTEKDLYKLLFSGVIHSSSYSKQVNAGGTSSNIQFHCVHRDYILDEVSIKFGGRGSEIFGESTTVGQSASGQASYFSSQHAALKALEGLKDYSNTDLFINTNEQGKIDIDAFIRRYHSSSSNEKLSEKDIEIVDPSIKGYRLTGKFDDLKGMPSVLLIMWQIIKMDAYRYDASYTSAMRRLYIPTIDDGLAYFKRMKGHSVLESLMDADKYSLEGTLISEDKTAGGSNGVLDVKEIMIPPSFRTFLGKALSADLAVKVLHQMQTGMSSTMTLDQLFTQLTQSVRYDRIHLASPVQGWAEGIEAIDKVVKPLLPFYFSPVCNVFFPNLYNSLRVSDGYYQTPTRVVTSNDGFLSGQAEALADLEYRAPHNVRKAWSYAARSSASEADKEEGGRFKSKPNLQDSLWHRGEIVAVHELGQGIRTKNLSTPTWLNNLNTSHNEQEQKRIDEGEEPEEDSLNESDAAGLESIRDSWASKYPKDPHAFNPWESQKVNGLFGYQRNIMNTLDYDYALSMVEARTGQLTGPFNPFVVTGYPCDVLDQSPDRPSYHGFVVDVTHTISGSGDMTTSVAFSSAMTYDELQTFDTPPVFPWIRLQLGLGEKSSLLNQPEATKKKASDYYKDVLGVGFADPTYMYDFDRGMARRVTLNTYSGDFAERKMGNSSFTGKNTVLQEDLDYAKSGLLTTVEGSLMLVRREIESMPDIEKENFTFVDFTAEDRANSDPSISVTSEKSNLTEDERKNIEDYYDKVAQPGKSTFLDYPEGEQEIKLTRPLLSPEPISGPLKDAWVVSTPRLFSDFFKLP